MKHNYSIEYEGVTLRPLEHKDIEQLRIWRNDAENSRYIRKIPQISPCDQENWYEDDLRDSSTLTFAICIGSELVGSVALYDLKDEDASFGRLMIGGAKGRGAGSRATIATLKIAFEELNLEEIDAEVSVDNTPAIVIYTRVGFCVVGRNYNTAAKMDEFKLRLTRGRFYCLLNQ